VIDHIPSLADRPTQERTMNHYLLSIIHPSTTPPPPDVLEPIMRNVAAFNRELQAAGAWVFAGGLEPPQAARLVRPEERSAGARTRVTDGPFAETKEFIGGICIIRAPDIEHALEWGRKAALATTLPIEVRAFQHAAEP
jgi:hypothetical protein